MAKSRACSAAQSARAGASSATAESVSVSPRAGRCGRPETSSTRRIASTRRGRANEREPDQACKKRHAEKGERAEAEPVPADPPIAQPGEDDEGPEDREEWNEARPKSLGGHGKAGPADGPLKPIKPLITSIRWRSTESDWPCCSAQ